MFRTHLARGAAAVALGAAVALAPAPALVQAAQSSNAAVHRQGDHPSTTKNPYTFAVIGDVPYGDAQIKLFPSWIDQINAANPKMTFHVGDIKNGSTRCDDPYYALIKSDFDRFVNPFVYTPGDNEWTDCHRANNGAYNPLDRLALDRKTFFANPGSTMGQNPATVTSQSYLGVPENVRLERAGVSFATVHVVGSNDDLNVWDGIGNTSVTSEQAADQAQRMTAAVENVHDAFAAARRNGDKAVVVMLQADMFDPTYDVQWKDNSAFKPLVQTLVDESNAFRGKTYLINGDSHVYNVDQPLADGSKWLGFYGVTGSSNLTRITTDGSSNNKDYLMFTVNPSKKGEPLSWVRVPYTQQAS
ncbi:hypothetical protein [Luteococcus sanguinis]|uniref:Calcineurin-like phosphoesterase domain-containing protein n=1 Tax=Luteococcus sanguinis TaxID=174038 RepID=A0ABW1X1B1_9ACTN